MILAAILVLFLFSLLIYAVNQLNFRPGYAWFLSVGGGFIAWVLVILSYLPVPEKIQLLDWSGSALFVSSPQLLLDEYSWAFAMAITTLLLAVLLTDVARVEEIEPLAWSSDLLLAAVGLLAVFSGNPLTLVLAWTIIDGVEVLIRFQQAADSQERERIVIAFSARAVGIFLVVSAILRASLINIEIAFPNIPPQVSGYLILAAGVRLGVLPPHPPFIVEEPTRRGLGTMARLVPVAAGLILLSRVAVVGASPEWSFGLLLVSSLSVFYGSLSWLWSRDELDGRVFWILSVAAFSVVAAVQSFPFASLSWGLSLIFSGGLLFLYSLRIRRFLWLPFLGMIGFSSLPFTQAWQGLAIFSSWHILIWLFFLPALVVLILGYYKHMTRSDELNDDIESWVWFVYPVGLAILPFSHFWVMWSLGGILVPDAGILAIHWWVGLIMLGLVALILFLSHAKFGWSWQFTGGLPAVISFGWFYRILWWGYRNLGKIVEYFTRLLEGEGGVLWAVLFLLLLLTLLLRGMGGV